MGRILPITTLVVELICLYCCLTLFGNERHQNHWNLGWCSFSLHGRDRWARNTTVSLDAFSLECSRSYRVAADSYVARAR
ncbi:hypothetical protein BJV82DRAFT_592061 [Fennellomyces sp. T-0311]|nr:hypothetical protein BJV82DRAFT_592061 [Fennellomyces sp. T-0311]